MDYKDQELAPLEEKQSQIEDQTIEETQGSSMQDWVKRHQEREIARSEIRKRVRGSTGKSEYFRPAKPKPTIQDEGKKTVAVYARVSTTSESQVSSIENQTLYYEKKISDNPNWEMQEIYSDEGKSGTSLKHRDAFRRMMADAEEQKMDLILCASVSRFARNISDCLDQVAKLKTMHPQKPIGVYFETENIYTLDPDSDQSFSIHAMLADWESANKSRRMILSYDQRILTGQYPVSDSLGLRHTKDGNLIIEPEEAKTVRFMFLASMIGYSREKIAEILTEKKRPTLKGNTRWTASMVASIMSNERTWGDLEARKTIVVDYKHGIVTRNRGQRDSAYVPGHHQGIVTPAIAKAAKLVAASSRSIAKGVFDLCVIQEGSLKGFIGLCPGFAGIDAETLMAVCLDVYTSEEIQKLSDRVRLIGEEGQSNILSMTLSGYQVPSGAYFINRTVPSLTVTPRGLKFNKVCHDRLQSCKYVDVLYHPVLQTLIVRASDEKSPNCVCWVNADGKPVQTLYTRAFSESIYMIQRWNSDMDYKIRGVLRKRGNTSFLVFSLDEPVVLAKTKPASSEAKSHESSENGMVQGEISEELTGMAYVVRMNRDSIISEIEEEDVLNHGVAIENPLIGSVPTQEEIETELEQLLQAM